ncbi:MAG: protein-L-isoaspartate O-methyltransferase [Halofilum sp. (in: g-proteobacteria)]
MEEMNFERARFNMVEQQVRPWTVLDGDVLRVLRTLPREHFVPEMYRRLAYSDTRIPLGHGQSMMAPVVEGRMLQGLELHPDDQALEIGTGSGFLTAGLAQLARSVESVDIYEDFTRTAGERLRALDISNVTLATGDAAQGWENGRQYDAIVLTGAVPEVPESYRYALRPGGRLIAIIGDRDRPIMEAVQIVRTGAEEWSSESLLETWVEPLVNAARPARFQF